MSRTSTSRPALPGSLTERLDTWLGDHGDALIGVRRHIHAHPEISGQEFRTTALVADQLSAAGLEPRIVPKGNGVICDVGEADGEALTIGLRADLDALPMQDAKDVSYRSTVDGACHACGHDVHTTIALGAGLILAEMARAGELPGRVRLLFQPSEETVPSGAPEMVAAGALDGVNSIYALHCDPKLPAGLLGTRPGPITAAADYINIHVTGPGGHTARPQMTSDLVYALSRVVVELPSLLARRIDPRASLSMIFGAINAGNAGNAIPQEGRLKGMVRVLDRHTWTRAPELIQTLIKELIASTGAECKVEYTRGLPPVVNDRHANAVLSAAGAAALGGSDRVVETPVSMGGEDFSWYLEEVPGVLARIGVGRPGESLDLHQPTFDVDERAIGYGVRVMVHTALAALSSATFR